MFTPAFELTLAARKDFVLGDNLSAGDEAPDFSAPASTGQTLTLSDYRGKWVVLYFYPKDNTPGCSRQACSFRDSNRKIQSLRAVVVGCSPDDLKSHDKFITKFDLPYVLISDPEHEVAEKYGVWVGKNMYGKKVMGIERSTFLINPDGVVTHVWKKVKVEHHADEVIDELTMMQS